MAAANRQGVEIGIRPPPPGPAEDPPNQRLPTPLNCPANNFLFSAGCDASHEMTDIPSDPLRFSSAHLFFTETAAISDSVAASDPAPYSTDFKVSANAGYPFTVAPNRVSAIYLDVVWKLSIGNGTNVNVTITGKTTKYPAFEAIANGNLIWSLTPPLGSGPSTGNLGQGNETSIVSGAGTISR
jgi:hypothetical protein